MNDSSHSPTSTARVRHESPIGRLEIQARAGCIARLDIAGLEPAPDDAEEAAERLSLAVAPHTLDVLDEARRQLDDYFARRRFEFDLPLDSLGTPFQEQVWSTLGRVPWGTATSYGALAEETGRPTGARAVGGAIRANPIALLVPCHRVLGAGARLTGYSPGQGVPTKRWLLDHEGIAYVA